MARLIGVDEAGYGPNLGPLVVAATAWEVPDRLLEADLYNELADVISCSRADARLPIADSKMLYPAGGLGILERSVLVMVGLRQPLPARWRDLWPLVDPDCTRRMHRLAWYADYDTPLPHAVSVGSVHGWIGSVRSALGRRQIEPPLIRAKVVFPEELNRLIDQHGSKGTALSAITFRLLRELTSTGEAGPILILCDKHGGRNKYAGLIQQHLGHQLVQVVREGRQESAYRFGPPQRRVTIRLRAKGESSLATALASMTAKYLRELAMLAFNAFWSRHLRGLRPTAGYPVDARRFMAEIAPVQGQLGIEPQTLWRRR